MKNDFRILAQGDMDGACFLYSIANAVNALAKNPIKPDGWKQGILSLPCGHQEFLAGDGTVNIEKKPKQLLKLSEAFQSAISTEPFAVHWQAQ